MLKTTRIYGQIAMPTGEMRNITSKKEIQKLMLEENVAATYPNRVLPLPFSSSQILNPPYIEVYHD